MHSELASRGTEIGQMPAVAAAGFGVLLAYRAANMHMAGSVRQDEATCCRQDGAFRLNRPLVRLAPYQLRLHVVVNRSAQSMSAVTMQQ
jgi:hypothetical protein